MLCQIDRILIRSYIKSYLICFVCLLGLYVVVDLFNNLDEFARVKDGLEAALLHIGMYYGTQLVIIFDRLSEAIVLLAAMFTIAWMQRNNELLPLLSAGVSTHRIVRPVLICCGIFILINVLNQELLIPKLGRFIIIRGDPDQESVLFATGAHDANGVHLSGETAVRKTMTVFKFAVYIPESILGGDVRHLQAKRAVYIPPSVQELSGGWMLYDATPAELDGRVPEDVLVPIAPGQYFLYSNVDFDRLTFANHYYNTKSTWQIFKEMGQADPIRLSGIAVMFHMRLTRPLLGMILVLMGLGLILSDQNRHLFVSIGSCLVLCALFFGAIVGARYLGDSQVLSPAMAAWLPVFLFGPLAFVLFDAVHT